MSQVTITLPDGSSRNVPAGTPVRDVAAAIKSIKFDKNTGNVVEVSLADRVAAAGVLLRSIGAIRDDNVTAILTMLQKKLNELNDSELQAVESRLAILGISQSSPA